MVTKAASVVIEFPVIYGSVGFAKSCRVGASVNRDNLTIAKADKVLCNRRVKCKMVAVPVGDHVEQGTLEGFEDKLTMEGMADIKRVGFSDEDISFGLSFKLKGLDRNLVAGFANRTGVLKILESEPIEEEDDDKDEDKDSD